MSIHYDITLHHDITLCQYIMPFLNIMLLGDLGGWRFKFCKCSVIGGFRVLGVGVCLIFFNVI